MNRTLKSFLSASRTLFRVTKSHRCRWGSHSPVLTFILILAVARSAFLDDADGQGHVGIPSGLPQLSRAEGVVAQYLMNPDGDLDGFLLTNSTLVRFPPHLSHVLAQTVVPGDMVRIEGFIEVPGTIHASAIIDLSSQRSALDSPPSPGHLRPPRQASNSRQPMTVSGTIRVLTRSRMGEIDGAVLSDGSIIHCSPSMGAHFSALLKEGQQVAASGHGAINEFGRSLEANSMGPSLGQLQTASPGPDPRAAPLPAAQR